MNVKCMWNIVELQYALEVLPPSLYLVWVHYHSVLWCTNSLSSHSRFCYHIVVRYLALNNYGINSTNVVFVALEHQLVLKYHHSFCQYHWCNKYFSSTVSWICRYSKIWRHNERGRFGEPETEGIHRQTQFSVRCVWCILCWRSEWHKSLDLDQF